MDAFGVKVTSMIIFIVSRPIGTVHVLVKQTKLIVSQAFFLGKPMRDAAFYFILQATPQLISDKKTHKHPIQNHRNERSNY